ncbi:MAG TPA: LPP20 family lipoprotein [Nitrospiraceae bacterium]|nr:LPP20 family lipoprotein [Nitrospiraceae bacterium]
MIDGLLCVRRIMMVVITLAALSGCAWFGGQPKPDWIDGVSAAYPSGQYLVGVGQAESRAVAEDRAYAALARIFKAEVSAQAKDWESYLVIEQRGQSSAERRLTLDNLTRVSTDKVLENVQIVDRWIDVPKGLHYALAGMHRPQAETAFMERISELDRSIGDDVEEFQRLSDNLARVKALRRAARNLVLRETYNADLRVIRPSGQGTVAAYRVSELTQQLEQFLAANLVLAVAVTGDQAEPAQRALIEGLLKEGLQVTSRPWGGDRLIGGDSSGPSPELLVRGVVRVWSIDVRDPQFKFVRWCSDFEVMNLTSQRVVGALSKGGKEGHLSDREATAKVVRVMQQEFSTDVAKAIAAHVYGESELPAQTSRPAGCPRDGLVSTPASAPH